jgi:hypothetical protein
LERLAWSVTGAQRRLELARVALKDFFIEHRHGMHDQRVESQWLALECEVDSANRQYMECAYQLRELEGR